MAQFFSRVNGHPTPYTLCGSDSQDLIRDLRDWYTLGDGRLYVDLFAVLAMLEFLQPDGQESVSLKSLCASRPNYEELVPVEKVRTRKHIYNLADKAMRRGYLERTTDEEPCFKLTLRGQSFVAMGLRRRASLCQSWIRHLSMQEAFERAAQTMADDEAGTDDPLDECASIQWTQLSPSQGRRGALLGGMSRGQDPLHSWMLRCHTSSPSSSLCSSRS